MNAGRLVARLVRLAVLGGDRGMARRALAPCPPGRRRSAADPDVRQIAAPIERVWAILADIERQPEWMHDLK